jgi:general secretion pathway protein K
MLIVLWTVALLALAGSRILVAARRESLIATSARDAASLKAAADGAIQRVIFARLAPDGNQWAADGLPRTIQIGHVPVIVRVDDEDDKINPNLASPALLRALMTEVGADRATAAAVTAGIIEWREGAAANDPSALARYAAAGRPYGPPGAPFVSLDEVGAVLGVTPVLLEHLRPHLTVLSDRDPGPSTRDPVVARALTDAGEGRSPVAEAETPLVSVSVDAHGPGRSRYTIRVVLETNAQAQGRQYRILSYDRLWDRP